MRGRFRLTFRISRILRHLVPLSRKRGVGRSGLAVWFARLFVLAFATAVMVAILPLSKAWMSNQAAFATGLTTYQDGRVPSRVGIIRSSAVSGFEDKTVKNSLLPTTKYQVKFDLAAVTRELPQVDQTALANMRENQIGISREVDVISNSMGRVVLNADGTHIRILAVKSVGADSLRVHLEGLELAAGDLVYVYGNAKNSHVAGPYTDKGPFKSGDVWTDTINGDTAIIEYYFKGAEHPFKIAELTHTLAGRKNAVFEPAVKQCELDERCFNDLEKDSVGRIDFVIAGQGEFVCTGTLLNDQPGDGAPFFLTAAHCLSTQAAAQTLEVWWFYQTTSCNSGVLRSDVTLSEPTGANLLATDSTVDATLLSIVGQIPNGAVFSGYDTSPMPAGTQVFGMHHPGPYAPPDSPSYLRHSHGTIQLTNDSCNGRPPFNAYEVAYDQGLSEPGSSGSGIWVSERGGNFLIGTLTCGTASCAVPDSNFDDFHKFSDFYPEIQNFLTQGLGGGGGGGDGSLAPVIASLSASLTGQVLSVSGTATDTSATMTSYNINLLNQSGTVVGSTGTTSFNFGAGPTESFTITLNNLNQFPSAVEASLTISDSSGHTSTPFTASFTQGDPGGPTLNGTSYNSASGKLVIKGAGFGGTVQVEVNGSIVAPPAALKVKPSGAKVKAFGSPVVLNLNSGPNRIRIIENGLRSNILVLTL